MAANEQLPTPDLKSKVAETDVAYLFYSDGVMTAKLKEGAVINIGSMRELLITAVELAEFKKYFVIIDARAVFHSEEDVRSFYSQNEFSCYRHADAIVINSLAARLVVNFYISVNKPPVPTKTFNDPESAKRWIDEMKQRLN